MEDACLLVRGTTAVRGVGAIAAVSPHRLCPVAVHRLSKHYGKKLENAHTRHPTKGFSSAEVIDEQGSEFHQNKTLRNPTTERTREIYTARPEKERKEREIGRTRDPDNSAKGDRVKNETYLDRPVA